MPIAGWWEALWPDPAGVLAAVGMDAGHGGDRPLLGRRLVHLANREDRAACHGDRHRPSYARPGASSADGKRRNELQLRHGQCVRDRQHLSRRPVDFVFMANAFHGVPDRPRLARAVRATLKPGGQFAIVNWHPRPREETTVLGEPRGPKTELRLSAEETTATVEAGGLRRACLIEVPPYHYGAVFERPRP